MELPRKKVRLSAPAKIGGKWHRAGAEPDVDAATELDLIAAGAIDPAGPSEPSQPDEFGEALAAGRITAHQFEAAVATQAKAISEAVVEAAVDAAMAEVMAEKDAALVAMEARAVEAEAQRDVLQARVQELQDAAKNTQSPQGATEAGLPADHVAPEGASAKPEEHQPAPTAGSAAADPATHETPKDAERPARPARTSTKKAAKASKG